MTQLNFDVLAHVEDTGDVHAGPGEYAGSRGKGKFIEGFAVTFTPHVEGVGLRYRADVKDTGDTGWVKDGAFAGTRGKRRPVEGFSIELTGKRLAEYDVVYMAHIEHVGDTPWVANGEYCGLHRQDRTVEGLAVKIVPRKANYITLISKASSGRGKALVITASPHGSTGIFVSEPDGSDFQQWDQRPLKGGKGYALINKARPDVCIARDNGQPAVLKSVASIETDDNCIWSDDTVPGTWNAIRSWTNPELKLNMRGNPPYADKENVLIVYPWAGAADNELWRKERPTYNLVGGTDEAGLNKVSHAIYDGCYPRIFTGVQEIGAFGIKSVNYDITTAPVFRIQPSELLREALTALNAEASKQPETAFVVDAVAESQSSFMVSVPHIVLTIEGDAPLVTAGSLEMAASVKLNPDRSLTLELRHGKLSLHEHPKIAEVLNQVFVPWLLEELNAHLLSHIAIPAIDLAGIAFTPPVLTTQGPFVIAAASKVPDRAIAPPAAPWPRGKVFVGADETVLDSLAASALADVRPSGEWSYGIDVFLCDIKLRARYGVHFANPRFVVTPSSGNRFKVRIELGGHADFTAKCGILSASPGAAASGHVNATAELSVNAENKVILTFKSLDGISLGWSFNGLPGWMDDVIGSILSAFNPVVQLAITGALSGKTFEVYSIPSIDAHIAGRTFELTLRDLTLESIADAGQKPVAVVSGTTAVKIK